MWNNAGKAPCSIMGPIHSMIHWLALYPGLFQLKVFCEHFNIQPVIMEQNFPSVQEAWP
jgi:hypothetical protein